MKNNEITLDGLLKGFPENFLDMGTNDRERINVLLENQRLASEKPSLFYACTTECNIYHLIYASLLGRLTNVFQINMVHDDFSHKYPPPSYESISYQKSKGLFRFFFPKSDPTPDNHFLLNDIMAELNTDSEFWRLKKLINGLQLIEAVDKITASGFRSSTVDMESWIAETYIASAWMPKKLKKRNDLIVIGRDKYALYELVRDILENKNNNFNVVVPPCLTVKEFFAIYNQKQIPKLCPQCARPLLKEAERTKKDEDKCSHGTDIFMITLESSVSDIEDAIRRPNSGIPNSEVVALTNELLSVLNLNVTIAKENGKDVRTTFKEKLINPTREQCKSFYKSVADFFIEISKSIEISEPAVQKISPDECYVIPPINWSKFFYGIRNSFETKVAVLLILYRSMEWGLRQAEVSNKLDELMREAKVDKIGKLQLDKSHKGFVSMEIKELNSLICDDYITFNPQSALYYPRFKKVDLVISRENLEKWFEDFKEANSSATPAKVKQQPPSQQKWKTKTSEN